MMQMILEDQWAVRKYRCLCMYELVFDAYVQVHSQIHVIINDLCSAVESCGVGGPRVSLCGACLLP